MIISTPLSIKHIAVIIYICCFWLLKDTCIQPLQTYQYQGLPNEATSNENSWYIHCHRFHEEYFLTDQREGFRNDVTDIPSTGSYQQAPSGEALGFAALENVAFCLLHAADDNNVQANVLPVPLYSLETHSQDGNTVIKNAPKSSLFDVSRCEMGNPFPTRNPFDVLINARNIVLPNEQDLSLFRTLSEVPNFPASLANSSDDSGKSLNTSSEESWRFWMPESPLPHSSLTWSNNTSASSGIHLSSPSNVTAASYSSEENVPRTVPHLPLTEDTPLQLPPDLESSITSETVNTQGYTHSSFLHPPESFQEAQNEPFYCENDDIFPNSKEQSAFVQTQSCEPLTHSKPTVFNEFQDTTVLSENYSKYSHYRRRPNKFCKFCFKNGELVFVFRSHWLKDNNGIVTCPVLRKYVCPICGASGDFAHTIKYCPKNNHNGVSFKFPPLHPTQKTLISSNSSCFSQNSTKIYHSTPKSTSSIVLPVSPLHTNTCNSQISTCADEYLPVTSSSADTESFCLERDANKGKLDTSDTLGVRPRNISERLNFAFPVANIVKRKKPEVCKFCLKNEEAPEVYSSHPLRNSAGVLECPFLRQLVCPICKATGDDAHTRKYCPFNTFEEFIRMAEHL